MMLCWAITELGEVSELLVTSQMADCFVFLSPFSDTRTKHKRLFLTLGESSDRCHDVCNCELFLLLQNGDLKAILLS